jgi:FtsH-binding integral membrane protein
MLWKAIGRSCPGISHELSELPCQDYVDWICVDGLLCGAVADGAGSASCSDKGARLAVHIALLTAAASIKKEKVIGNPVDWSSEEDSRKFFEDLVPRIRSKIRKKADDLKVAVYELSCTLLVFVASDHYISAMQIGDGFIVVSMEGKDEYELLFSPQKGEFINETTFLTSGDALKKMQVQVRSGNPSFICASTDGLEKVALQLNGWTAHQNFFSLFKERLEKVANGEDEARYIEDFLNSARLNSRTDDDKTLLICLLSKSSNQKIKSSPEHPEGRSENIMISERPRRIPEDGFLQAPTYSSDIKENSDFPTYQSTQNLGSREGNNLRLPEINKNVTRTSFLLPVVVCSILLGWLFFRFSIVFVASTFFLSAVSFVVKNFYSRLSKDERRVNRFIFVISTLLLICLSYLTLKSKPSDFSRDLISLLYSVITFLGILTGSILLALVNIHACRDLGGDLRIATPYKINKLPYVVLSSFLGFVLGSIAHALIAQIKP